MPQRSQYVCDECGKIVVLGYCSPKPDDWWGYGNIIFCPACFATLSACVRSAIKRLQECLGSTIKGCPNDTARSRVSAMLVREIANHIWARSDVD